MEKASILTFLNAKLKRRPAETDIDQIIQDVLDELSEELFLETTDESQTLTSGDTYLTVPTDYLSLISIQLNDGSVDRPPLVALPRGYAQYQKLISGSVSNYSGYPTHYTERRGRFYIWPTVGQSFTSVITYFKKHADPGYNAIEFGDEFGLLIKRGATFHFALEKNLANYIKIWGTLYEQSKQKRRALVKPPVRIVKG